MSYKNSPSKSVHTHTHTHTGNILDIPIFSKLYEFYKILTPAITSFPKSKRYTLGQKLDSITLEILELLFSIPVSDNKLTTLNLISIKLDLLRVLIRLSKDSQAIKDKKYLELQTILQEIGRMLGGWIKSTTKQTPPKKEPFS